VEIVSGGSGMKLLLLALILISLNWMVAHAQEHGRPAPSPTVRATPAPTPVPTPQGWVTFNCVPGRFSVFMPEIPTDKTETVQSDHGPYTTHLFVVRGEKSVFLIGWVDYDPSFNFNTTGELDMNRENFLKGVNATLVNNRTVTLDGYQSIEFTAENSETLFKSRVYMVGRRPYQLVAATSKGLDDSININRFFDSFKVRVR